MVNKLAEKLINEMHPIRNINVDLYTLSPNSHKRVWWVCAQGHIWEAPIRDRTEGQGCPYCSHHRVTQETSLAYVSPRLAQEWHPTKNGILTPEMCYLIPIKKFGGFVKKNILGRRILVIEIFLDVVALIVLIKK